MTCQMPRLGCGETNPRHSGRALMVEFSEMPPWWRAIFRSPPHCWFTGFAHTPSKNAQQHDTHCDVTLHQKKNCSCVGKNSTHGRTGRRKKTSSPKCPAQNWPRAKDLFLVVHTTTPPSACGSLWPSNTKLPIWVSPSCASSVAQRLAFGRCRCECGCR